MNEKTATDTASATPASAGAATTSTDDVDARARPGRRPVEERQQAVMDLFAGKATVDQIAAASG